MKGIHLILIALGTVVVVAVLWLRDDGSAPPAAQQPQADVHRSTTLGIDASPAGLTEEPASAASVSNDSTPAAADASPPEPISLSEALRMPAGFERAQLLERLGYDGARESLAAAINALAGITGPAERAAFLRGIFARAAQGAPGETIQAIGLLPKGTEREIALAALMANLRPTPIPLRDQAELLDMYGPLGSLLAPLFNDPPLAAEYARGLLQGIEKVRFLSTAAGLAAAANPQLAMSFGEGLQGKERNEFLVGLASGWARTAGDAAWAWALQEPDAALRAGLQTSIIASWAAKDPQAAASQIALITDADSRRRAVEAIGSSWGSADTQAAFGWANSLPDPAERNAAVAAISHEAPVGIGVVLQMGEQGYPVISGLVPGGPASATGALTNGYQIAAVSNGSGGFIDLQNKSMEEITGLIRGRPGTNLWLQVFQPGGAPNARTTVQVPRQQLMFKRPP